MSFTDHPTADEIVVKNLVDGPVSPTVFTWNGHELSRVKMHHVGYEVSLGRNHPVPNHTVWVGKSWDEAMRHGRNYAEMAAMMIDEKRPGWVVTERGNT